MMARAGKRMLQGSFWRSTWQDVFEENLTELCNAKILSTTEKSVSFQHSIGLVLQIPLYEILRYC
jgi:hypothetical protein